MNFTFYVLRIVFAKRQWVTFFVMLLSTFLIILFFLFFKTFSKYYIDELKLVYPSVYIVKDKKIDSFKVDFC
jgi:putative effector of murein hydrolase